MGATIKTTKNIRSIYKRVINFKIFPHTTATRTIRYLEINLTIDVYELYQRNYKTVIKDM